MPRVRPIKNLWFRYGQHINLDSGVIAKILVNYGIIQMIGEDKYREIEGIVTMTDKAYEDAVLDLLKEKRGLYES
jgi:hypothetical protein